MRIEREFEVKRQQDEVFDYLADVTNEAKWNPWAKWVKRVGDGPIGQGAVFRGSYQGFGELEQDLGVYERPARLSYHSVPKGLKEANMIFELSASGAGTRIRMAGEALPAGLMRLMEPMMGMRMKPHFKDLEEGLVRELS